VCATDKIGTPVTLLRGSSALPCLFKLLYACNGTDFLIAVIPNIITILKKAKHSKYKPEDRIPEDIFKVFTEAIGFCIEGRKHSHTQTRHIANVLRSGTTFCGTAPPARLYPT
jgi:hypothetical protein